MIDGTKSRHNVLYVKDQRFLKVLVIFVQLEERE